MKEDIIRMPDRNLLVDCMKGILIILVVLGHTYNEFCSNFIYLFHVGLFFTLSGYCFNQKYTESFASLWILFKKRIKSLWVPYVVYNFVFLLLQNFWLHIGFLTSDKAYFSYNPFLNDGFCLPISFGGAVKAFIKSLLFMNSRPFAGGLWFLGGLFYVTFLYAIIQFLMRKLQIEKFHIICSIIFLVAGWLIVKLGYIQKLSILKQAAIILISEILFCIGTYVREYIFVPKFKCRFYYAGFTAFFLILCILSSFGSVSIASVNIKNPLFYIAGIISGGGLLVCFIKIMEIMNAKRLVSFFSYIGTKTVPVLALHPICFKIVTFIQWKIYGGDKIMLAMYPVWKNTVLWSLAYLIVGLFVPLLIAVLFSKNKFCRAVLKC